MYRYISFAGGSSSNSQRREGRRKKPEAKHNIVSSERIRLAVMKVINFFFLAIYHEKRPEGGGQHGALNTRSERLEMIEKESAGGGGAVQ